MAKHSEWSQSISSQESCMHDFRETAYRSICIKCGKEENRIEMVAEVPIVQSGPDQGKLIGANLAPDQNDSAHSDSYYLYRKIQDMRRLGGKMNVQSSIIKESEMLYRKVASRKYVRSAYPNYLSMYFATRNDPNSQLMFFDFCENLDVERISLSKPFFRMNKSDILYRDSDGQSDRICTFPPRNSTDKMLARFYDELFPNSEENDEYERVTILKDAGIIYERMETNCLDTGRNPRSLYGACLLLVCTLHGKPVNLTRVANTVRMSESILNKRLRELNSTPGTGLMVRDYLDTPATEWRTNPLPPCMNQRHTVNTDSPDSQDSQESISDLSYSQVSILGLHDSGDEISLASDDERDVESYLLTQEEVQDRTKRWEEVFGSYTPRKTSSRIPFTPENYNTITRYFAPHSETSSQEQEPSVARPIPEQRRKRRRTKSVPIPPGNKRITEYFSPVSSQVSLPSSDERSIISPVPNYSQTLFEDSDKDLTRIHPYLTPEGSLMPVPPPHPYMTPPYSDNGDELDFSLSDHDPSFRDLH